MLYTNVRDLAYMSVRLKLMITVNLALKQHHRVVYSSQAIHHVAQQVASLYWASVNRDIRTRNSYEKGIERLVDLTSRE